MTLRATALECLSEDTLLALIDGALDPDEKRAAEEHLGGCEPCLRLLAASADTSDDNAITPPSKTRATAAGAAFELISRYQVTGPIGAGGVGIVYSAHDPELGRPVALKLLRAELSARSDSKSRVLREAQAMARLKHPNVVAIYDVGTWREQVFIAMELVEGGTLRKWLSAAPRSWREMVQVYLAAGRGLSAAHAAGLVHRDFKPDNVLVAPDGRVLVTDFGMARLAQSELEAPQPANLAPPTSAAPSPAGEISHAPSTLTPMGGVVGTPAYMAPEQMKGGRADARSDLFAFCTALYEAAAGTRPYPGADFAAMSKRAESGVLEPPKRKMPGWLQRELAHGLRPNPKDRHASIDELLAGLERGLGPSRAMRIAKPALIALWLVSLIAVAILAADRTGLWARLERMTAQERQISAALAQAKLALREHGRIAAAGILRQAETSAPGNPRILLGLSEVLLELSANSEANEVLARAWLRKDELRPDEQTQLEIFRLRALREGDKGVALARTYWQAAPADLDRGLILARELSFSGKYADALALFDKLHQLPPPAGNDLRIDAGEMIAAQNKGDYARAVAAARRAYASEEAIGDRAGMARARRAEAIGLQRENSDPALIRRTLEDAISIARAADDRPDMAVPELSLGTIQMGAGDFADARASFEEAMQIFKETGNRLNEGVALLDLSGLLRRQRDLAGAIDRTTAAQSLFLEIGEKSRLSAVLIQLGDLREELGDLNGAATALEQVIAMQQPVKDPIALLDALVGLSHVRLEQGELAEAEKRLDEARAGAATATKRSIVNLYWLDGALAFAQGKYPAAEAAANGGLKVAAETGFTDEEAELDSQLARALIEEGRLPEAREALARGQALVAKSKSTVARGELAVADGRLLAKEDPRHLARAEAVIGSALEEAAHGGDAVDQWEARLALAEMEAQSKNRDDRAGLEQLARQARAQGYGLYVRYAEAALARK